jgi:hypothetical protein
VSIQAANAIQKNTSDTVASHSQPVSTAVAYVADEYIPSGNTAAHHSPGASSRRLRKRFTVTQMSSGSHAVATHHVTTVSGQTLSRPAL